MSTFSNTDTGSKPADPYTAASKTSDSAADKITELSKFIGHCKFGMMTTRDPSNERLVSRCMAVAGKEHGDTDLIFVTNTESHKTDELKNDPHVNISFLDSSGQWASVAGKSSIETNRDKVKEYYSSTLQAWFGKLDSKRDGSAKDPRIGLIRVTMQTATYAVTDKTLLERSAAIAKGALTGQVAVVNQIKELSSAEIDVLRLPHQTNIVQTA